MNTGDYIRLENEYGAQNYKPLDVVLTRGLGIWVWAEQGFFWPKNMTAFRRI
jgi:ornithine--oxo-acid transaminase